MGFLVIPSASNTLANAIFFPSANTGSTLTGLVNGTSYKIYSTTVGPVVTPNAPTPTTPTTPTTTWQNIVPVNSGAEGVSAAYVTLVGGNYRIATNTPNANGRAKIMLPPAGTVVNLEMSMQYNGLTRLVCRQVADDFDTSTDSIVFDINRSAGDSDTLTRSDTFTVQPGKTMLHFISVTTAGQYFTINAASRVRIGSSVPTTPTAPTTTWAPLIPLDGGPNGADAAFFRGVVSVENNAYRVTTAASNTNGRARYALPTAGTRLEMDSVIQFNDATRLICRQVDNNDSTGGTTVFDVTRTSTGQVLTRSDEFTVEAGKTMLHFIGVTATGQYFTINTDTRIRIAPNTVPSQFGTGDWSVSTGSAASQVSLNIMTLPSNGGSAITALQYSINGGTSWTALTGTGTGARTLTMAASGTSYTFLVRAVNANGNGTASATKSITSGTTGTTPTAPVTNVRTFTYQNSLFDHQGNGGADDDTRVPNWTQRMASAAGLTYQAVGFFGFAQQWTLPPNASAGYENVTAPAGLGFGQTWSGYSTINTLTFVPDNFDSFDRAPNVNSTNGASPIGANQNYRDRLLQIIDSWETNAPMANSEKRKYRVYSGWADFNRSGGQWNTYTTAQLNTYLTYSYGQYQTWYVDLVNMLKTARPNLDIELIDLQRVVMLTWRNTALNTLSGSVMWEDQAPHGRETWYLLAAMVYYMELYGVKPPANFNPLAGTGAGSGVNSVMINNWSAIVDYAWDALGN